MIKRDDLTDKNGDGMMKKELGIAVCGLACCICSENDICGGCHSEDCKDSAVCINRRCAKEKQMTHCFVCAADCHKGMLQKPKPYAFTQFAKRYGVDHLLECLKRNEENGIIYHREGINGDYDAFDDAEALIAFIRTGISPNADPS